jgi:NitT/TauT family transport system substrate-binding protein
MSSIHAKEMSRRGFLKRASSLAAAGYLGAHHAGSVAAQPLETTTIRLVHAPSICVAPQYLAEQFMRMDGFKDIQYLPLGSRNGPQAVADGRADIAMWDAPALMPLLDANSKLVILAGVHAGCYELFARDDIRSIVGLKGRTVAVQYFNGGDHVLLSSMLAYVGVNPQRDVNWISGESSRDAMGLFVEGKADAFLGFAQQPEELRLKNVGHLIINTAEDRPWSQYFCCMIAANRDFIERNPMAAKSVVRGVLKAADLCASDPTGAARFLSDKLYEPRFQIGLNVMTRIPFDFWRKANPEDTIRFHALRLYEVGMIQTPPNKIIIRNTDWRILDQLKRELKA